MEITLNLDEKETDHLMGCTDSLQICRIVAGVLAQIKEKIKEKNDEGDGLEIDGSPSSPSIEISPPSQ